MGGSLFCHSNPYKPRNWYYVVEKTYISSSFARSKAKILFVGHTHVPIAITRKNFFCVYIRSPQHPRSCPLQNSIARFSTAAASDSRGTAIRAPHT